MLFPSHRLLESIDGRVDDFLIWPAREQDLNIRLERLLQSRKAREQQVHDTLAKEVGWSMLVGKHPSMLEALRQVGLFATSNAPVLITGETGTGKELFAQLAENELFGHSRGAFTDAHADQKGLAAMAEGGTLFLDEVDALSFPNQTKLLRLLQEGTYRALGADRFTRANLRIIAASNKCIEACVEQERFREDLYFRLNVLRLQLPPLRERRGDIALLAQHFLEIECGHPGAVQKRFSPATLRKLASHTWPGNIRELLNVVQRAAVCCTGRQIMPFDIVLANEMSHPGSVSADGTFQSAKQQAIASFEKSYVERLLARHEGNITQAAREAGKERRSFGRLVKKYANPAEKFVPPHSDKKAG